MGIRTAWRALWRGDQRQEQKASAVGALVSFQNVGQPRWMDRRYDKLADEGYKRNVIAYRCIRVIAHGAANVPWLLYDAAGGAGGGARPVPGFVLRRCPPPGGGG